MNKLREYILCAAIWFDDGKKYCLQPNNIKTGVVLCGHRHGSIYSQIGRLVSDRQKVGLHEKEQGFLTSHNRFVDRKEAFIIATNNNQVLPGHRGDKLFSEDLY